MNDEQLQQWVERVSTESFGRPFKHRATFNSRLRSTGGRYFTRSHNIEISSLQYELYGVEETEKIIKHELCHYHLHLMKRGYNHRDEDFKQLLKQVGGSRYCKSLPDAMGGNRRLPYKYRLVCVSCKMEYMRKRKVDVRKYLCGKCHGKLKLVELDSASHS
ncbi:SprT family protein [Paenibacillus albiflavus]|uniref:SprT family protein n=1 Tax=Paenibacillus albiflavus TaxID=2545760 RepID=A0A4R4EA94_9BACL|nr:SprT family protein [Paenibacillus albiflavus]TCZ76549.1 SprT family protein [Paenibacillus albiflavus]